MLTSLQVASRMSKRMSPDKAYHGHDEVLSCSPRRETTSQSCESCTGAGRPSPISCLWYLLREYGSPLPISAIGLLIGRGCGRRCRDIQGQKYTGQEGSQALHPQDHAMTTHTQRQ